MIIYNFPYRKAHCNNVWALITCWRLHLSLNVGECCDGTCNPAKQHGSAFLSNNAQLWHDERVSQANNKLSNSTTHKRGCHGFVFLSMMTGWHSWTSSQLLQLLLLYRHLPTTIHHLQYMASHWGYCSLVGGRGSDFKLSVFQGLRSHPISTLG